MMKTLIAVKGIDAERKRYLQELGINDGEDLLRLGRTERQREELAEKLCVAEQKDGNKDAYKEKYVKNVESWVRQVDLWRVEGMDEDTAYFLVQLGIRYAEDLVQVDPEKAYPLLCSLANTQTDFEVVSYDKFKKIIAKASKVSSRYPAYQTRLETLMNQKVDEIVKKGLMNKQTSGSRNSREIYKEIQKIKIQDIIGGETLEINAPIPTYLFYSTVNEETVRDTQNTRILVKGVGELAEIESVLPLPRAIKGTFLILNGGAQLPENKDEQQQKNALRNALVEIGGITTPKEAEDGKERPHGYTDYYGNFVIALPERYNLQESITFTVSKDLGKYTITLSAGEFISHVKQYEIMTEIQNPLYADGYVSDFSETPFVVIKEVFEGYECSNSKILPSVKLMEKESGEAIDLPTDTAPLRVFSYSMLQRLVEPEVSPAADEISGSSRVALKGGVDVMKFRETMAKEPSKWPQMSSLGIGYILRMHQAWVPDGYALGNLLYSLVLAPGEEQRLVVRENKHSYRIEDDASGMEATAENYENYQMDDISASYDYALNQLSQANSGYKYSTVASSAGMQGGFAGIGSGFGGMLGLSAAISKTSGSGSSSASQANTHSEASSAAQTFQHGIKTASEKISSARRLSISMATSEVSDSVATRIIANHNHSHAMTVQYWEVMRRYRLETCIEGVELTLFVPMKPILFLNDGHYYFDYSKSMNPQSFQKRYGTIISYMNDLLPYLPSKYRAGLDLMHKYSVLPNWGVKEQYSGTRTLRLTFSAVLFSFDKIRAFIELKNGKGRIAGTVQFTAMGIAKDCETRSDLLEVIKARRNSTTATTICSCTFTIPGDIAEDELDYVRLEHSLQEYKYVLYKNPAALGMNGENPDELYDRMMSRVWDYYKDNDDSKGDLRKLEFFEQVLPEAWMLPNVTLTADELSELGAPVIFDEKLEYSSSEENLHLSFPDRVLSSQISAYFSGAGYTLKYNEFEKMEATLHHIVSNTVKYSQVIWASLSADERAILLEQYTIDMNVDGLDVSESEKLEQSLLNCINVNKLLGFYGNCMIFPFVIPEKLARKFGKSAAQIQDALYRYHMNYFRVPTTTVSIPTDGMIGEAVLGRTNVSEKIDLTRFWNWKDSPIDSMSIDSSYLNGTDYLSGKTTKDITAMNLQGALATTPVTAADLVSALVNKQTPQFENITGLDQLKDIMNQATDSASTGRDKALEASGEMAKTALEYAFKGAELDAKKEKAKAESEKTKEESEKTKEKESSGFNLDINSLSGFMKIVEKMMSLGMSAEDVIALLTGENISQEEVVTIANNLLTGEKEGGETKNG